MSTVYDVGVVGLGAVGSAAAYHAAKQGLRVIGFDRFAPPHTQGSTHGGSRIIRRAYFEGGVFLPLLERAYQCWSELEADTGSKLLHMNGSLTIGQRDGRVFAGAEATASAHGIPYEVLDPAEVMKRFPAFSLATGEAALFEPQAGWLDPEVAVQAHLDGARDRGAQLRVDERVTSWRPRADGVEVETEHAACFVTRLIICSGGWMRSMLPSLDLPLVLERQVNVWYAPGSSAEAFAPDRCPVYVWAYESDHVLYGFPNHGGGVKAGLHHTGAAARQPDDLDRDVHQEDVDRLTERMQQLLPDACGHIVQAATCFYTNTPDERFIIDVHPDLPNVLMASACSGHGFKFSSAVGEQLALLAAGIEPAVDLDPYRADRFEAQEFENPDAR